MNTGKPTILPDGYRVQFLERQVAAGRSVVFSPAPNGGCRVDVYDALDTPLVADKFGFTVGSAIDAAADDLRDK